MTDAPSDASDPFSASAAQDSDANRGWEAEASISDGSSWADQSAVALELTRMWVKEHQTATMLGAFAVGVFVGALTRD